MKRLSKKKKIYLNDFFYVNQRKLNLDKLTVYRREVSRDQWSMTHFSSCYYLPIVSGQNPPIHGNLCRVLREAYVWQWTVMG